MKYNSHRNKILSTIRNNDYINNIVCAIRKSVQKNILIIEDKKCNDDIKRHSQFIKNEINCCIYNDYTKIFFCDTLILQNTTHDILQKFKDQTYIYIVHTNASFWNTTFKNTVKTNDKFIDKYIFVSEFIKLKFEENIFPIKKTSYVIENSVVKNAENNKNETKGLFVSCGSYDETKNYYELILLFQKIDKKYNLEIYGTVDDNNYYNKLSKYINENKLSNIKLFTNTNNYIERLQEAEYFILLSKNEGCSYAILDAIMLNKKIICSSECNTFEQIKYYPNKCIFKENNTLFDWFSINKVEYYPKYYIKNMYKNAIINHFKYKIGKKNVSNIADVLNDTKINNCTKNGFSFLLRIKNEKETIRKCIEDIVDLADEIIVVDNGSTDNTLNIIKELEILYDNVYVYEYKINIPRYGNEHIENFKRNDIHKNNTLANYYNWTASKATYNKKIKWDGDFYCIRNNLKKLLDAYINIDNDEFSVWFSGITLFINNENDTYLKNKSYYNEYRLFYNKNQKIWNDNVCDGKNYCETATSFVNRSKKYKKLDPIFIEIKMTSKNEFASRSYIDIDDNRDNIDLLLLNKLSKNIPDPLLIQTKNLYNDVHNFLPVQYLDKWNNAMIMYEKRKTILLIIDSYGWAFDNISKNIVEYNTNYNIKITTYPELYNKIINNLTTNQWRSQYNYCDVDIQNIDSVIFFWYGENENQLILKYFIENKKIIGCKTINLCIYDYSLWINNHDKKIEHIRRDNIKCFLKHINNYLFGSPFIPSLLEEIFPEAQKIHKYPCYDGVDSNLFYFQKYNDSIYTKNKLIIGWIGNSNPNAHGINKGFKQIKECVESMSDKFIFMPQDSFTCGKISHSNIPIYLEKIDIIICFSLAEGTPNQILEASSSGKCWISTKVGIVVELYNTLQNNPTGILIERDKKNLTDALLELYNNRNLIVKYGENGRKAIEKEWDWKNKVNQFYDLFNAL